MKPYHRPEKDTVNPPGQIVNPVLPSGRHKLKDGCCHQTVLAGYRCSDCSLRVVDSRFAAAHYQDGRDLKNEQKRKG